MTSYYYDVFITSSRILGSAQVKKVEKPNFLLFHPVCLKFGTGRNFEMLIAEGKPKLKLENDLGNKIAIFYRF